MPSKGIDVKYIGLIGGIALASCGPRLAYSVAVEDPAAPGQAHSELRLANIGRNDTAVELSRQRPVGAAATGNTALLFSPGRTHILAATVEYFGAEVDVWLNLYNSGLQPEPQAVTGGPVFQLSDDLIGTAAETACDQTALAAGYQAQVDADPSLPAGTVAQLVAGSGAQILLASVPGWADDDAFVLEMQDSPAVTALLPDGSVLPLISEGASDLTFFITYRFQSGGWSIDTCALAQPVLAPRPTPTHAAAIGPGGDITLNGLVLNDATSGAPASGGAEPAERLDGPY